MPPCYVLQQQMTCFARLPKDTALTEDRRIPRTGSKCETRIGHSLNPLSQDAQRQLAAVSFVSPLLCFSAARFLQRTGQEEMGSDREPWFSEGRRYYRFHFKFLWRVSGQQNPLPWPRRYHLWMPSLALHKKWKQPICSWISKQPKREYSIASVCLFFFFQVL